PAASVRRWSGVGPAPCAGARLYQVREPRVALVLPAAAAEHAVVADAGLHVMAPEIGAHVGAQIVRRHRLADRADVVLLALDGEQRGAPARARVDAAAPPPEPTPPDPPT